MKEKIYLDKEGYQNYLKEIEALRKKVEENAKEMSEYASDDAYGDGWHDNFAYEETLRKENALFYELNQKIEGLKKIEIIDKKGKEDQVTVGSIVEVQFEGEEKTEVYEITGDTSSKIDSEVVTITLNSPLGKALYGKKRGDCFSYKVKENIMTGKIVYLDQKEISGKS